MECHRQNHSNSEHFVTTENGTHGGFKPDLLFTGNVRGFQYYVGMNMLNRTMPGARLQLVREHNKEYDEFAIALHLNKLKLDTSRLNPMKFCLN